jgi:hypothetical protein
MWALRAFARGVLYGMALFALVAIWAACRQDYRQYPLDYQAPHAVPTVEEFLIGDDE